MFSGIIALGVEGKFRFWKFMARKKLYRHVLKHFTKKKNKMKHLTTSLPPSSYFHLSSQG